MTNKQNENQSIVVRTKSEDKARSEAIFDAGFGAGVATATRGMIRREPSQQMIYRRDWRKVHASSESREKMLNYIDGLFNE